MGQFLRRESILKNGFPHGYPVMRCDCGDEVHCDDSWANSCDSCPREYNGSGQLLAPREQWGEETGETFLPGEDCGEMEDY